MSPFFSASLIACCIHSLSSNRQSSLSDSFMVYHSILELWGNPGFSATRLHFFCIANKYRLGCLLESPKEKPEQYLPYESRLFSSIFLGFGRDVHDRLDTLPWFDQSQVISQLFPTRRWQLAIESSPYPLRWRFFFCPIFLTYLNYLILLLSFCCLRTFCFPFSSSAYNELVQKICIFYSFLQYPLLDCTIMFSSLINFEKIQLFGRIKPTG